MLAVLERDRTRAGLLSLQLDQLLQLVRDDPQRSWPHRPLA
jgi:hypothetical protein